MKQISTGVYQTMRKDNSIYYRSSITYNNKHISLGSYDTWEAAHRCYTEAALILRDHGRTIDDYHPDQTLAFEKWVILINFRDHNIYFSTPIYIRSKYFLYYLSPALALKFDMEDLFYYSSHKIMQRNGHLFVADYGMQVNILNRYHIKNYGIKDKDYRFINGDETDFRYENIEIINTFHGVSHVTVGGVTKYKARIHIRGNYVIGTYDTEIEAAIAYNKAIDTLSANGFRKNFMPNYIEGLSPSSYANIYTGLSISPKIKNYKP